MTEDRERLEALAEEATELGQVRAELRIERERTGRLADDINRMRKSLDLQAQIADAKPRPPHWTVRPPKRGHTAMAVLQLTDLHFDEVIDPAEVLGLNAYNREIATQRLERAFRGTVTMAKDRFKGYAWDGCIVLDTGDTFSGEIHPELVQTNVGTIIEALVHYVEPYAAGLGLLADEFKRVHVIRVPGNHDRRGKKPRYKTRVRDSFSWAFSKQLAREFRTDERVTFDIPDSLATIARIYDLRVLMLHGEEFKGGSGISAALAPLFIGEARKQIQHTLASQYTDQDLRFDLMLLGHFHQRYALPGFLVGGCLKGFDELAFGRGFRYAPASQEFLVVAPDRGLVFNAPVWVQDRKVEGW